MSGPSYTYTADVPQPATPMNVTAPIIRENFQAIAELVAVNHVGFNSSDAGKHNYVSLEFQSTAPDIQASELTMYCQATGSPNAAEIFYTYPDNTTDTDLNVPNQLTDQDVPITGTGTSSGDATQGYCTFPSGIQIRWGVAVAAVKQQSTYFVTGTPSFSYSLFCGASSPIQVDCNTPMGIQVNGYINATYMIPLFPGANPATSGITTDFNFFLMGM